MNKGFSVEEDIDFSDDEIDFLGSHAIKQNSNPTNSEQAAGYNPFTRNEAPCPSRDIFSHSNDNIDVTKSRFFEVNNKHHKNNNADFILNSLLNNDDDDELLSQIDLDSAACSPALPLMIRGKQKSTSSLDARTNQSNSHESQSNNTQSNNQFRFQPSKKFSSIDQHNSRNDQTPKSHANRLPVPFSNGGSSTRTGENRGQFTEPCVTPVRSISNPPSVNRNSFETPTAVMGGDRGSRKREHPMAKTLSKSCPKQRRFPGPAGLLPTLDTVSCFDKLKSPVSDANKQKRTLTPLKRETPIDNIISSSQDDDFKRVLWGDVKRQVSVLFPNIRQEMICDILRKATVNQLNNGKVSLLCGMLKSFSTSGSGGKLVIKDPTGEINGTLHKNVLDEYESDLCHGSGIILKDVSVYSPSLKKHYINIIPSNIVQIFPAEHDACSQTQQTQLQQPRFDKENLVELNHGKQRVQQANSKISELQNQDHHRQPGPSKLFLQNQGQPGPSNISSQQLGPSNMFSQQPGPSVLVSQQSGPSNIFSQQPGSSDLVSQQPGPSNMLGNENELNSFFSEEFF